MKIILIILFTIAVTTHGYSQKPKKNSKSVPKSTVLAKAENITASLVDHKGSFAFYLLNTNGKKIDSVLIKAIVNKAPENLPANCKIVPYNAKGDKLYLVSWTENSTSGDAKSKLENTTETHSQIWDVNGKSALHSNVQKVVNISEIVYLDPGKNASKTVEKVRREGFEFTLLSDGDIALKNKTQQDKMSYDAASKKYVPVKISSAPAKKK